MDLRIKKTYSALNRAFTKLLSEQRYEDITVAAICDEAIIRRTTFYKHFRDKDDYFRFFANEVRTELMAHGIRDAAAAVSGDAPSLGQREAILRCVTSYMLDNKELMDNIFNSSASGTMTIVVSNATSNILRETYGETYGDAIPDDFDQSCDFTAGGVVRTLRQWLESEDPLGSESEFVSTTAEFIGRVMTPGA